MGLNSRFKKIIAGATFLFFFWQTATAYSLPVRQTEQRIRRFDERALTALPKGIGKIQSDSSKPGTKTVLLVLNAHTSSDAQKHIAQLLEFFQSEGIDLIGLEGADEKIDGKIFRDFPFKDSLARAAWQMVKEGKFTGAEYFYITAEKLPHFYGLENRNLYLENRDAFTHTSTQAEELKSTLEPLQNGMTSLKKKIYSNRLFDFDRINVLYREGNLSYMDYLIGVIDAAKNAHISLPEFSNVYALSKAIEKEKKISTTGLQKDVQKIRGSLAKEDLDETIFTLMAGEKSTVHSTDDIIENYKKIQTYFSDLISQKKIDPKKLNHFSRYFDWLTSFVSFDSTKLFEELDTLGQKIYERFGKSEKEKRLISLVESFETFQRMITIQMTQKDLERQKDTGSFQIETLIDFMKRELKGHAPEIASSEVVKIFDAEESAQRFYELAEKRNQVFVEKIIREMDHARKDASVIVVGGFHEKGLQNALKDRGISTVVISPRIDGHASDIPYFARMLGKPTQLEVALNQAMSAIVQLTPVLGIYLGDRVTDKNILDILAVLQGKPESWNRGFKDLNKKLKKIEIGPLVYSQNENGTFSVPIPIVNQKTHNGIIVTLEVQVNENEPNTYKQIGIEPLVQASIVPATQPRPSINNNFISHFSPRFSPRFTGPEVFVGPVALGAIRLPNRFAHGPVAARSEVRAKTMKVYGTEEVAPTSVLAVIKALKQDLILENVEDSRDRNNLAVPEFKMVRLKNLTRLFDQNQTPAYLLWLDLESVLQFFSRHADVRAWTNPKNAVSNGAEPGFYLGWRKDQRPQAILEAAQQWLDQKAKEANKIIEANRLSRRSEVRISFPGDNKKLLERLLTIYHEGATGQISPSPSLQQEADQIAVKLFTQKGKGVLDLIENLLDQNEVENRFDKYVGMPLMGIVFEIARRIQDNPELLEQAVRIGGKIPRTTFTKHEVDLHFRAIEEMQEDNLVAQMFRVPAVLNLLDFLRRQGWQPRIERVVRGGTIVISVLDRSQRWSSDAMNNEEFKNELGAKSLAVENATNRRIHIITHSESDRRSEVRSKEQRVMNEMVIILEDLVKSIRTEQEGKGAEEVIGNIEFWKDKFNGNVDWANVAVNAVLPRASELEPKLVQPTSTLLTSVKKIRLLINALNELYFPEKGGSSRSEARTLPIEEEEIFRPGISREDQDALAHAKEQLAFFAVKPFLTEADREEQERTERKVANIRERARSEARPLVVAPTVPTVEEALIQAIQKQIMAEIQRPETMEESEQLARELLIAAKLPSLLPEGILSLREVVEFSINQIRPLLEKAGTPQKIRQIGARLLAAVQPTVPTHEEALREAILAQLEGAVFHAPTDTEAERLALAIVTAAKLPEAARPQKGLLRGQLAKFTTIPIAVILERAKTTQEITKVGEILFQAIRSESRELTVPTVEEALREAILRQLAAIISQPKTIRESRQLGQKILNALPLRETIKLPVGLSNQNEVVRSVNSEVAKVLGKIKTEHVIVEAGKQLLAAVQPTVPSPEEALRASILERIGNSIAAVTVVGPEAQRLPSENVVTSVVARNLANQVLTAAQAVSTTQLPLEKISITARLTQQQVAELLTSKLSPVLEQAETIAQINELGERLLAALRSEVREQNILTPQEIDKRISEIEKESLPGRLAQKAGKLMIYINGQQPQAFSQAINFTPFQGQLYVKHIAGNEIKFHSVSSSGIAEIIESELPTLVAQSFIPRSEVRGRVEALLKIALSTKESERELRTAAINAIVAIGPVAVAPLTEELKTLRTAAIDQKSSESFKRLETVINLISSIAAQAGQLERTRIDSVLAVQAVSELEKVLRAPALAQSYRFAVAAIGNLALSYGVVAPSTVTSLRRLLASEEPLDLRSAAAVALAQVAGHSETIADLARITPQIVSDLVSLALSEKPEEQELRIAIFDAVFHAIVGISSTAIAPLTEKLKTLRRDTIDNPSELNIDRLNRVVGLLNNIASQAAKVGQSPINSSLASEAISQLEPILRAPALAAVHQFTILAIGNLVASSQIQLPQAAEKSIVQLLENQATSKEVRLAAISVLGRSEVRPPVLRELASAQPEPAVVIAIILGRVPTSEQLAQLTALINQRLNLLRQPVVEASFLARLFNQFPAIEQTPILAALIQEGLKTLAGNPKAQTAFLKSIFGREVAVQTTPQELTQLLTQLSAQPAKFSEAVIVILSRVPTSATTQLTELIRQRLNALKQPAPEASFIAQFFNQFPAEEQAPVLTGLIQKGLNTLAGTPEAQTAFLKSIFGREVAVQTTPQELTQLLTQRLTQLSAQQPTTLFTSPTELERVLAVFIPSVFSQVSSPEKARVLARQILSEFGIAPRLTVLRQQLAGLNQEAIGGFVLGRVNSVIGQQLVSVSLPQIIGALTTVSQFIRSSEQALPIFESLIPALFNQTKGPNEVQALARQIFVQFGITNPEVLAQLPTLQEPKTAAEFVLTQIRPVIQRAALDSFDRIANVISAARPETRVKAVEVAEVIQLFNLTVTGVDTLAADRIARIVNQSSEQEERKALALSALKALGVREPETFYIPVNFAQQLKTSIHQVAQDFPIEFERLVATKAFLATIFKVMELNQEPLHLKFLTQIAENLKTSRQLALFTEAAASILIAQPVGKAGKDIRAIYTLQTVLQNLKTKEEVAKESVRFLLFAEVGPFFTPDLARVKVKAKEVVLVASGLTPEEAKASVKLQEVNRKIDEANSLPQVNQVLASREVVQIISNAKNLESAVNQVVTAFQLQLSIVIIENVIARKIGLVIEQLPLAEAQKVVPQVIQAAAGVLIQRPETRTTLEQPIAVLGERLGVSQVALETLPSTQFKNVESIVFFLANPEELKNLSPSVQKTVNEILAKNVISRVEALLEVAQSPTNPKYLNYIFQVSPEVRQLLANPNPFLLEQFLSIVKQPEGLNELNPERRFDLIATLFSAALTFVSPQELGIERLTQPLENVGRQTLSTERFRGSLGIGEPTRQAVEPLRPFLGRGSFTNAPASRAEVREIQPSISELANHSGITPPPFGPPFTFKRSNPAELTQETQGLASRAEGVLEKTVAKQPKAPVVFEGKTARVVVQTGPLAELENGQARPLILPVANEGGVSVNIPRTEEELVAAMAKYISQREAITMFVRLSADLADDLKTMPDKDETVLRDLEEEAKTNPKIESTLQFYATFASLAKLGIPITFVVSQKEQAPALTNSFHFYLRAKKIKLSAKVLTKVEYFDENNGPSKLAIDKAEGRFYYLASFEEATTVKPKVHDLSAELVATDQRDGGKIKGLSASAKEMAAIAAAILLRQFKNEFQAQANILIPNSALFDWVNLKLFERAVQLYLAKQA